MIQGNESLAILQQTVIQGGYCIGCGSCASLPESPVTIELNQFGCFTAKVNPSVTIPKSIPASEVCPFASPAPNEDDLAENYFADNPQRDGRLGFYRSICGVTLRKVIIARTSSGGIGRWLVQELMASERVDAVIQVAATGKDHQGQMLFEYRVFRDTATASTGATSAYYPVEMSKVLREVIDVPGRYAITGVPCYIKSIRLLAEQNSIIKERIRYCIGLVCGHLKSTAYAEMLAWQKGIHPSEVVGVDFRKKFPGARVTRKVL